MSLAVGEALASLLLGLSCTRRVLVISVCLRVAFEKSDVHLILWLLRGAWFFCFEAPGTFLSSESNSFHLSPRRPFWVNYARDPVAPCRVQIRLLFISRMSSAARLVQINSAPCLVLFSSSCCLF